MGSKLEFYKAYFDASWANPPSSNVEAIETYMAEDFQSLDQDGNVMMNKAAQIGMIQLLFTAFKDFKFVRSDMREEGDNVIVSGHWEGTFTSDLDLSPLGMGVIPASGEKIVWPEATSKIKIEGDQIESITPVGDTGGVKGFLAALGVEPPSE